MSEPSDALGDPHKNNFDFVRLFAAFLVLFGHQFVLSGRGEPASNILDRTLGTVGVFIFFAISGYLVAQSWQRSSSAVRFALRRIVRIYPAFAVCTLLTAFVLGPLVTTVPNEYFSQPGTLDYLRQLYFSIKLGLPGVFENNPFPRAVNGSTWTIPIELQWYVLLAALGFTGILRRPILMVSTTVLVLVYALQQFYTGKHGTAPPLFEFGVCFLVGASASNFRYQWLQQRGTALLWIVAGAVICCVLGAQYLAMLTLVPLAAIVIGESRTPFLSRFGRFGDVSYGTYLYAFPVQQTIIWATANSVPFVASVALSVLVTVVMAALSWKLVEQPAMRWTDRQRRSAKGTSSAEGRRSL